MGIVAPPVLQAGRIDRRAIVARVPPAAVAGWAMERSAFAGLVRVSSGAVFGAPRACRCDPRKERWSKPTAAAEYVYKTSF
jgi:hypothetical protein